MTDGTLFEKMAEPFRKLMSLPAEDGLGGAEFPGEETGPVFRGCAYPESPGEKNFAPERGLGGRIRLTAIDSAATAELGYGDFVRRLSDGTVFRITGEVRRSPASLGLIAAYAEPVSSQPHTGPAQSAGNAGSPEEDGGEGAV
jgi:hypothetical protein